MATIGLAVLVREMSVTERMLRVVTWVLGLLT
jgi:hypothetical protein